MLQIALSETLMKILTSFPFFSFFLNRKRANPFPFFLIPNEFFLGKNYYTTKILMMPTTFPDISNKICINQTNEAESRQLCLTLKKKKRKREKKNWKRVFDK